MGLAGSLIAVLAYGASIYGWGVWPAHLLFASRDRPLGVGSVLAFGLTILAFLGGLLNLANIAYPMSLDILIVIGWGLVGARIFMALRRSNGPAGDFEESPLILGLIFTAILVFHCVTLLPSLTLNIFDDFFFYLVAPLRALQTGSLGRNPFDGAGATSLGVQAFFQSFIVARFSFDYLPAFDNTFCLLITLALIAELGRRMDLPLIVRLMSLGSALALNPQIVNTSAVYSASALSLAFLMALQIAVDQENARQRWLAMFAAGLVGGTLVGLKSSLAIYAGAVGLSFFTLLLFADADRKRTILDAAAIVSGAAAMLLPWSLIYAADYKTLWMLYRNRAQLVSDTPDGTLINEPSLAALLSLKDAFLGGPMIAYAAVIATIGVIGLAAAFHVRRANGSDRSLSAIAFAHASGFYAMFGFLVLLTDLSSVLRYMAPLSIVGIAICTFRVAAWLPPGPSKFAIGSLVPAIAVALFAGNAKDRIDWAIGHRTQISFESGRSAPVTPYLRAALDGAYTSWIKSIQHRLPEGSGILTWHPYAFLMDFNRNPIYTLNDGSYHNPLFAFPADGDFERTTQIMREIGIRYVIWEYVGLQYVTQTVQNYPGMTKSRYTLARTQSLSMFRTKDYFQSLDRAGALLASDGRIAVFDLERAGSRSNK